MRTIVLIPFEPAPQDPVWMKKKHAGRKLTAEEFQMFAQYQFEKELQGLKKKQLEIPGKSTFIRIMDDYHIRKTQCLISHSCAGRNYSVYDGVFDRCGKMNPFEVW
jgi:hypothetical protein